LADGKSIGGKAFHPILALQAAPGGGKSFLLDELASLNEDDFNNYLNAKQHTSEQEDEQKYVEYVNDIVDMLRKSITICITFNGHSTYNFHRYVDEDFERGLVMRILWSYFFDNEKLSWMDFCDRFKDKLGSLKINKAIKIILHHIEYLYNSKKSVFLCVDETMQILSRACNDEQNQDRINNFLTNLYIPYQGTLDKEAKGGLIRFNFILTTLDAVYVRESRTSSGRDINWIPLRRLNITESIELLNDLTIELEWDRKFIINMCISDCNGHPRTLEKLYELLNGNQTVLKVSNFATIIEMLTTQISAWFSNISFSVIELALLGNSVPLGKNIKMSDGKELSVKKLVASGTYINSVTKQDNAVNIIPTLTPVSLYYFCVTNNEDGKAKIIAKILKDILLLEDYFDFRSNDGKAFEEFHMNWELLYRVLHDEKAISLPEIYGLCQEGEEGVKIKLQQKKIVKLSNNIEFPPDEIRDEKGNILKDLEKYLFVPTKSTNSGFDMVTFEKKVEGGFIAINIKCKFSWPNSSTTLSSSEIRDKYESTEKKYINHVKREPQSITRFIKEVELQASDTSVGKLGMTKEDIYLVVISWRKVEKLDSNVKDNKNIIVVRKENLENIYSPSLVSRPQFYDEISKKIEDQTQV
jgi:hypothetical protein